MCVSECVCESECVCMWVTECVYVCVCECMSVCVCAWVWVHCESVSECVCVRARLYIPVMARRQFCAFHSPSTFLQVQDIEPRPPGPCDKGSYFTSHLASPLYTYFETVIWLFRKKKTDLLCLKLFFPFFTALQKYLFSWFWRKQAHGKSKAKRRNEAKQAGPRDKMGERWSAVVSAASTTGNFLLLCLCGIAFMAFSTHSKNKKWGEYLFNFLIDISNNILTSKTFRSFVKLPFMYAVLATIWSSATHTICNTPAVGAHHRRYSLAHALNPSTGLGGRAEFRVRYRMTRETLAWK